MVELTVEADDETSAFYTVESVVENLVCGSIENSTVFSVEETEDSTEQQRRDEKNGLYPDRTDISN